MIRLIQIVASVSHRLSRYRLLASIGRRGLRRLFGPGVLQTLSLIALGRSAGFSLDEIAGMFCADGEVRIERDRLASKADEIDRTIRRLSALRDELRHAADCPAPSHLECPTFRRLMGAAAARQGEDRIGRQPVRVRTARRS